jgi:hypothetical protein
MAGYVKEAGLLAWLPFDMTLGLAILTALLVIIRLVTSPVPQQMHGVILAFVLLIPPVLYSASTDYGTDKVGRLFAFTFLSALAPVVLIRDRRDVARFLWALVAMGGVVVVSALINPQLSSDYADAPITTESVDTIGLGSAAGVVLVMFGIGLIWNSVPLLAVVPAAAAVYVLLQSGSRGPLFSALLAVLAGVVLTRTRPRFRRIAVFGALLAVGVLIAYSAAPAASRSRIAGFLEGDTAGSVDARVQLYHDAYESILKHPLGIGWGNYEGIAFGGYTYPHDLPLEVLAEAGVIFGGLFLLWICHVVIRTHRITTDFIGAAVFAIALFWLGKALVSGDINDNRVLFYALGVAVAADAVWWRGDRDLEKSKPSGPARPGATATAGPAAHRVLPDRVVVVRGAPAGARAGRELGHP